MFVSLPTGYGKSVCYFPLPFVFDCLRRVEKKSIVVVASPLVALMKDQVAQCSSCGLATGFVSTDPNDHSETGDGSQLSDCFHESRGVVCRTKNGEN